MDPPSRKMMTMKKRQNFLKRAKLGCSRKNWPKFGNCGSNGPNFEAPILNRYFLKWPKERPKYFLRFFRGHPNRSRSTKRKPIGRGNDNKLNCRVLQAFGNAKNDFAGATLSVFGIFVDFFLWNLCHFDWKYQPNGGAC